MDINYEKNLEVTYEEMQKKLAGYQTRFAGLEPRWFTVNQSVRSYGTMLYVFGSVSIVTLSDYKGNKTLRYKVVFEHANTKYRFKDNSDLYCNTYPEAAKIIEDCFQILKQEEAEYVRV